MCASISAKQVRLLKQSGKFPSRFNCLLLWRAFFFFFRKKNILLQHCWKVAGGRTDTESVISRWGKVSNSKSNKTLNSRKGVYLLDACSHIHKGFFFPFSFCVSENCQMWSLTVFGGICELEREEVIYSPPVWAKLAAGLQSWPRTRLTVTNNTVSSVPVSIMQSLDPNIFSSASSSKVMSPAQTPLKG